MECGGIEGLKWLDCQHGLWEANPCCSQTKVKRPSAPKSQHKRKISRCRAKAAVKWSFFVPAASCGQFEKCDQCAVMKEK